MTTLNKKKAQRRINKIIRGVNESILKDDIWNGRFYLQQLASWIYPWADNSGLTGNVYCKMIDLRTGFTKEYMFDLIDFEHPFTSHIWLTVNKFIVEDSNVWAENPNPYYQEKIMYRKDNSTPSY